MGDAYLCASGVPRRNGHEHGREIANMALSVVKNIKSFKVPHLPGQVVDVRIGMHTGNFKLKILKERTRKCLLLLQVQ